MDELPSNAQGLGPAKEPDKKTKKDKKPLEKITTGEVEVRPKGLAYKAKNLFFGDEARSAVRYITDDVLFPALRNLVVDTTTKFIERAIYGDKTPPSRRTYGSGPSRATYSTPVSRAGAYQGPFASRNQALSERQSPRRRNNMQIDEIIISSKADAEAVLDMLKTVIDQYESASVQDLKDLLGWPSQFTDINYGWTALGSADIHPVREGYLLDLPPAELLNS